jgi:arginase
MDRQIVSLLCRTADRDPEAADGTRELAELLDARIIGTLGEAGPFDWEEDLRASHGCLLEAGGQIDDAFEAGLVPILLAGDCSVCIATLPVLARHHPDARVLWLDAHGDFNTPETTMSGYLGGMCLAGACGLWSTGFGVGPEPARIVTYGVRELEGGERVNLDRSGVHRIDDVSALAGLEVFVHVDLDVIDPQELPAAFPVPGGPSPSELQELLHVVMRTCTVVGAEITSAAPGHGEVAAEAIAPLLSAREDA